jgi:transposase-like protein
MPRSYAPQFRAMVIEQVRAGRRVAEVAAELELCQGTVFHGPARIASIAASWPGRPRKNRRSYGQRSAGSPSSSPSWTPSNGPASCSKGPGGAPNGLKC